MNLDGNILVKNNILIINIEGRIWKRKQICRNIEGNAGYEEYIDAVYNFFSKNMPDEHLHYHQKVLISFTQHYSEKRRMLDADNMEVKPFIDAICMYFLDDDSPEQCAIMLDGVADEREYLVIKIAPYPKDKSDRRS